MGVARTLRREELVFLPHFLPSVEPPSFISGSQVSCGLSQLSDCDPNVLNILQLGALPPSLGTESFNKTFPHPEVLPYST